MKKPTWTTLSMLLCFIVIYSQLQSTSRKSKRSFRDIPGGATSCLSGRNKNYVKKSCSSGSTPRDYVCLKFACEGGRSPFELRTCGLPTAPGCVAGSTTCTFSRGNGKCSKCDTDNCNT